MYQMTDSWAEVQRQLLEADLQGADLAKRLNSAQSFRCRPQSVRAATCAPRLLETSIGATGGFGLLEAQKVVYVDLGRR